MAHFSVEPNERVTYSLKFEDEHLLIVEKPTRLVSTPGLGHDRSSLLNGLFCVYGKQLQNLGKDRDFGMLHRLDRATSGMLIVALRASAYDRLREMFERREIRKFYFAIAAGAPRHTSGVIRRPILEEKRESNRREMKLARIGSAGKPAVTAYRVLDASPSASLLECRAVTGRLHQVRVHLESIGCPIFGDDLYAPPAIGEGAPRLALHAHRLAFKHPITGEAIDARSPLPKDLRKVAQRLGLDPTRCEQIEADEPDSAD